VSPRGKPSLRRRIAQHVLMPLIVTWALGTVVVLAVAEHFAEQAFDRSLLDDAYALSSHVRSNGPALSLALTNDEMKTLLFDQSESMYFAVLRPDGALVAGHAGLPAAPLAAPGEHEFADVSFEGRRVRTVSLRSGERSTPFVVVMAQTTASRTHLLQRLLGYSALPQAVLLVLLAWWLRRRIEDDLKPLAELEQAIERRHAADLAPLPAQVTAGASTRDVERIAQSVDALLARLAQSVQAQREFAGNVAHELRTPLAGIRAQAAFALARAEPPVWREQLEGIAQAEQRASRLVDQLLALARADEGQGGVAMESIELHVIAREVLLRFMPRARSAGVDLGGDGLDEPLVARGDRALVEGILNNLVDNALRYGSNASAPRITVALARTEGGVEISVSDNGPGLRQGAADRLTERWVRGEHSRRAGDGAGLGLAIVSRYAGLMGARLTFGDAPGGGLRACLVLTA
jgi:two-component system sensor histidine kinase TctE